MYIIGEYPRKWYFFSKIVLTFCEKKCLVIEKIIWNSRIITTNYQISGPYTYVNGNTFFSSSKWMVAGAGDPLPSSSLFVHGDSPCLGEMWSAQGSIVFDKFKLTNNRCTIIQGQTCLHSMHKYLPKVLVVPLSNDQIHMSSETLLRHFEEFGVPSNADEFVFPKTAFITVTAYQNQQVSFRFRLSKYFLKSSQIFSRQNNAWVVWKSSFHFRLAKYFLRFARAQFFSSKQRIQVRFSKIDWLKMINFRFRFLLNGAARSVSETFSSK